MRTQRANLPLPRSTSEVTVRKPLSKLAGERQRMRGEGDIELEIREFWIHIFFIKGTNPSHEGPTMA